MSYNTSRRRTRSTYESGAPTTGDRDEQAPPPAKRQKISNNRGEHITDDDTPKGLDPNRGRTRGRYQRPVYQRPVYRNYVRSRSPSSERSLSPICRVRSRSRSRSSSVNESRSPSPRPSSNERSDSATPAAASEVAPAAASTATQPLSPLSHIGSKSNAPGDAAPVAIVDPAPVAAAAPPTPAPSLDRGSQILEKFGDAPPVVMFTSYRSPARDAPSVVCTLLATDAGNISGCYTSERHGSRVTDILLARIHQTYAGFPFFKTSRHLLSYIKSELVLLPQNPLGMIQMIFAASGMVTLDVEYRVAGSDGRDETKHVSAFNTFARFIDRVDATCIAQDDVALQKIVAQLAKEEGRKKGKTEAGANKTKAAQTTPAAPRPTQQQQQPQRSPSPLREGITAPDAAEAAGIKITVPLGNSRPPKTTTAALKRAGSNGGNRWNCDFGKHDYRSNNNNSVDCEEEGEIASEEQESDPDADRDVPAAPREQQWDRRNFSDAALETFPQVTVYPRKQKWGRPW